MSKSKFLNALTLLMLMAIVPWGIDVRDARALNVDNNPNSPGFGYYIPDYFTTPNWANSPPLTKFLDGLPGICGAAIGPAANNLGQCISLAAADKTTYPGSDYYEIELVQFREEMHREFPDLNNANKMAATSGGTLLRGYRQINTADANLLTPHYLGPLILAAKDRPVRIKFKNSLPAGANGNLFVPVDTTIMGSGPFEINYNPETKAVGDTVTGDFKQNRATLHLHGGRSPWISDGTPHQWITPVAETSGNPYPKGVSVAYVPDMWFNPDGSTITSCAGKTTCAVAGASNNPGQGYQTFYFTNQQSGRLMFYHDHAWGITRLNVYVGEAAGYLITDPTEEAAINTGKLPNLCDTTPGGTNPTAACEYRYGIPLVIQDKTYVNATLGGDPTVYTMATDPTWAWGSNPAKPVTANPQTGDLWWPHVYMPAQNPFNPNLSGINDMGRWHYGPWFFPSTPKCGTVVGGEVATKPFCIEYGPVVNPYANGGTQPPEIPGTPNPSWGAEAFLDTMIVNGTAYPTITLDPKEYRFRILNAAHDRFLNLQLYIAANKNNPTTPGAGAPVFTGTTDQLTEVAMVQAAFNGAYPATWPIDGREGGVPDPATRGPAFIQIGTEGGFLPKPAVVTNQPIQWNVDPTMFNVGNVLQQRDGGGTVILGPAERADVIVDFSSFAGKTLILYNDAPTAFPALDPHYDYYTGAPDRRDIGGYKPIPAGVGPNIRTVMQIVVTGAPGVPVPDGYSAGRLAALETAFAGTTGIFQSAQDPIVVGQTAYNTTYATTFPATWPNWGLSRISDGAISFQRVDGVLEQNFTMKAKAIHDEMGATFDDYGRMSAKLGLEMPFTNAAIANFNLQNYIDAATEQVKEGEIQIWRITHNGVDTHPIHFHLFDVQVLNRVGWDGFIRLPDDNELGWKDTVRMSPLEDTIVALRPIKPQVPFTLPNSIRPMNPSQPLGSMMGFSQIDPYTGNAPTVPTTNQIINFGHEYVWHCHILSHEENDMMRPVIFNTDQLLYVVNPGAGISKWDMGTWSQLNAVDPTSMVASGTLLYAKGMAGNPGVWQWDGAKWTNINSVTPAKMVAAGTILYISGMAGNDGVWKWNGAAWTNINSVNPANMVAVGSTLYVSGMAGNAGVWKWDGAAWTQLGAIDPASMVVSGSNLYASFTGQGVWSWNGAAWIQLGGVDPASMIASGSFLYGNYTGQGIWSWNGTAWTQLGGTDPASMVASGSNLYASFTGQGIWRWNGAAWTQLGGTDPASMVASGAVLYASFAGQGLYKWEAGVWTQLTPTDPAIIVAGF